MGLYRQMIGRVLRPADGKADAIVLDHSGAVFRHGFAEDRVEWTLDPDRARREPEHAAAVRRASHRACSNARNAAPSAPPARHARIADFCRSGRRARWSSHRRRISAGRCATGAPTATSYDPANATWHAHAGPYRRGARLQAGWVAHKYKEKFGRVSAVGRSARADSADARSPIVGALAHDRFCRGGRHEANSKDQRPIRAALDRNAALARLSRPQSDRARRILDRIEIELASHGGKDNGKLPVTYQNLKDFGICNRTDIARGKRELCALGFVECTRGHAGNGEFRRPTLFRLTYLPAYGKGPTHEWRQIETVEEAEKIAKKVRCTSNHAAAKTKHRSRKT